MLTKRESFCLTLMSFLLLVAATSSVTADTRTYYIAAEEVLWDYAPSYPINEITGEEFTDDQKVFVDGSSDDRIGHVYKKAQFIEYTDGTFSAVKERDEQWEHLGVLGPAILANVGDIIVVVFKNNTRNPASVHPHGVFYQKDSEGALYDDETGGADKNDDAVPPGGTHTYLWEVPDRAGPSKWSRDPVVWLYHSHVDENGRLDEARSTNAGLLGPIIISRKGWRRSNGKLRGFEREFVVVFTVFDENNSYFLDENIGNLAPGADPEDEDFQESNLMHSINGYVYSKIPGLTMRKGDNVRWYTLALGTEVDLHTPHWHGNTLEWDRKRMDVVNLLPATQRALDMKPDNAGVWLFHCHVNDHFDAGMVTTYTVESFKRGFSLFRDAYHTNENRALQADGRAHGI
jgi:FtsP/CotA-like multicopper oxidase with cupredoxin domain